jgi:biopolymer transport protein ExbD
MKIPGAQKLHYDAGPNMTPLVDIMLVILIFLMLAGTFYGAEHYLVSNLPLSRSGAGGQTIPPGFIPDEPIDIRVDSPTPDGFVATAGRIRTNDARKLTQELERMRIALNIAGKDTNHLQVKIGPSKTVKYRYLVQVYEAALNAGYKKVAFATSH